MYGVSFSGSHVGGVEFGCTTHSCTSAYCVLCQRMFLVPPPFSYAFRLSPSVRYSDDSPKPSVANGFSFGVSPWSDLSGTIAASIAGFRFVSLSGGMTLPFWAMSRISGIFVSFGSLRTSTTFHCGDRPCGGALPLLPDVHHRVARKNIKPV